MTTVCPLCPGACAGADLGPLLTADLAWLWTQVAARVERTGDRDQTHGRFRVHAPADVAGRAAATGLLGGALRPGQKRTVDLAELTDRLRPRGAHLTPGAVAAHAAGRPLGQLAQERAARRTRTAQVRTALEELVADLPDHVAALAGPDPVARLARSGAIARTAAARDPLGVVASAGHVLHRLPAPPGRTDRRTLVPADPHALDSGPLPWLVLTITDRAGTRPAREAWAQLGVDMDTVTGGLVLTGVHPAGWTVPPGAAYTLPTRELAGVTWSAPTTPGAVVHVTENPSVLQAAVEAHPGAAVACINGTPSTVVLAALARFTDAGWAVRVRADFDVRGLQHTAAMLVACPGAEPWRMSAADYRAHVQPTAEPTLAEQLPDTPWDRRLGEVMSATRVPVFEEDLLGELLGDL